MDNWNGQNVDSANPEDFDFAFKAVELANDLAATGHRITLQRNRGLCTVTVGTMSTQVRIHTYLNRVIDLSTRVPTPVREVFDKHEVVFVLDGHGAPALRAVFKSDRRYATKLVQLDSGKRWAEMKVTITQ